MKDSKNPDRKKRILLIGGLPPPLGGISVSFKQLVDELSSRDDIQIDILDFNKDRYKSSGTWKHYWHFLTSIFIKIPHNDIVTVYMATTAMPTAGLFLLIICRIFRKKFILRKAAGLDYLALGLFRGLLADWVARQSNLFLVETRQLLEILKARGINQIKWYPTSRPRKILHLTEKTSCQRFVFIGQVREHKGIKELVECFRDAPDDITVDIYGPIFEDLPKNIFENLQNVRYMGTLEPEKVITTFSQYDMSLLPTKATTEGYPGAVLESYSAGIPIITTRCGAIPEIVDKTSGLFIEPGDITSFKKAVMKVSQDIALFNNLRDGALKKSMEFDSKLWADLFVKYCIECP